MKNAYKVLLAVLVVALAVYGLWPLIIDLVIPPSPFW
jgi:hypothetical protein